MMPCGRDLFALCAFILLLPAVPARALELTLLWETPGFEAPESVVHDAARGVFYVSSVNGEPGALDGNGFISRLSPGGEILSLRWVTGLHGPKGMAVAGDRLYVADINAVVEIDIPSGRIVKRHEDASAEFMNDVAAAPDGGVYATDTGTNRIYRLADGTLEVWLENPALDGPNGVFVQEDRLVVGAWGEGGEDPRPGALLAVSLADRSITAVSGEGIGHLDGLEADPAGGWFVTDWVNGRVMHYTPGGRAVTLLSPGRGTADIEVVTAPERLLLPRMLDGSVAAYRIERGAD